MMRGKSQASELILEVVKSNNSLSYLKEFEKGYTFVINHREKNFFLGITYVW